MIETKLIGDIAAPQASIWDVIVNALPDHAQTEKIR
jgi:hypothetical protein